MPIDLVSPPYGPFVTGRGAQINGRVLEAVDGGDEDGKDISASSYEVHLRAYTNGDAVALSYDFTLTKSAPTTGYFNKYVSFSSSSGADSLVWEEVLIDTSTTDTNTSSGKAERILRRWMQPVEDAAP